MWGDRRGLLVTGVCAAALLGVELAVWDGDTTSRWGGAWPSVLLLLLGAVGAAAAVATWRWPLLAAAVVWVTALVAVPVPSWQPFGAVLVALYVLARTASAEVARLALVLALVPLGVNAWNSAGFAGPVTAGTLLPVAGIWLLVAAAVFAAGRAGHRSASRVQDLEETLRRAEEEFRDEERRRIARDLHDSVAHSVTAMVLRAAGARGPAGAAGDPRVVEALRDVEESGAQAVRELHRMLHTMRGSALEDAPHARQPGLAQVRELVDRTRGAGLHVELVRTGEPRPLDASVDLAAYRCVQEALSNAMRHAGRGSSVRVAISHDDVLGIDVVSTPPAGRAAVPAPRSGGFGIVGLSERLASVGGELEVGPTSDGYRLHARLPVADRAVAR